MDKLFLKFASDEILDNLNIDSRLKQTLKNILSNLDSYFANHKYDNLDYKTLLEDNLISTLNLKSIINTKDFLDFYNQTKTKPGNIKPTKEEILNKYILSKGIYPKLSIVVTNNVNFNTLYNEQENTILVNEQSLQDEFLEKKLCHEFIHFLTSCNKNKYTDINDSYNKITIECLTEMLTNEMYPNTNNYQNYIELIKFQNSLLNINSQDFTYFLQRRVNPKQELISKEFQKNLEQFYLANPNYSKTSSEIASSTPEFINLQRIIYNDIISKIDWNNINEYINLSSKLLRPPFYDEEYVNDFVNRLDATFAKLNQDVEVEDLLNYIKIRREKVLSDNNLTKPIKPSNVQDHINNIIDINSSSKKRPFIKEEIIENIYNKKQSSINMI